MEVSQFYQQAFLKSAEKLIGIEAETRAILEKIASEKEGAIAKKLIGKEFDYGTLEDENAWGCNNYKGFTYKAIKVKAKVSSDIIGNIVQYSTLYKPDLINMTVYFMRNPIEVLESKKTMTNKEIALLKELVWWWKQSKNGNNPDGYNHRDLYDIHRELCDLKHRFYMVVYLCWEFDFKRITADDFMERGLRGVKPLC